MSIETICDWCKHADKCERRKSLQRRTVLEGGMGGVVEVATIKEVVVTCKDYECPFPLEKAEAIEKKSEEETHGEEDE